MNFDYPEGATPLEYEELIELIPAHITEQSELNEWESNNIEEAKIWLETTNEDVLTEKFIKKLHQRMFNQTWKWAGKFRKSNKNIGVYWHEISPSLHNLLQDTKIQIDLRSYCTDEIAVRFHHRLVQIHCFANGNGRHARLARDKLCEKLEINKFSWGNSNLTNASETRRKYIEALHCADKHNYNPLKHFVRS